MGRKLFFYYDQACYHYRIEGSFLFHAISFFISVFGMSDLLPFFHAKVQVGAGGNYGTYGTQSGAYEKSARSSRVQNAIKVPQDYSPIRVFLKPKCLTGKRKMKKKK